MEYNLRLQQHVMQSQSNATTKTLAECRCRKHALSFKNMVNSNYN